jgi:1,4-dihydroxy-2-naphthoyl-CoA synthase
MPQRGNISTAVFSASAQTTRRDPSQFQYVKFAIEKNMARITLARPEHNLLNELMLREIADAILTAGETETAKLIVLDSACKVFSGGIDIGEYTSQRVFQMLDAFHSAFAAMLDVGKPVLCVVNGPAIGGGTELALFGDLVESAVCAARNYDRRIPSSCIDDSSLSGGTEGGAGNYSDRRAD